MISLSLCRFCVYSIRLLKYMFYWRVLKSQWKDIKNMFRFGDLTRFQMKEVIGVGQPTLAGIWFEH